MRLPDDHHELIQALGGEGDALDFHGLKDVKRAQAILTDLAIAAAVADDPEAAQLGPDELGPVASLAARRRWGLAYTSLVDALVECERRFLLDMREVLA